MTDAYGNAEPSAPQPAAYQPPQPAAYQPPQPVAYPAQPAAPAQPAYPAQQAFPGQPADPNLQQQGYAQQPGYGYPPAVPAQRKWSGMAIAGFVVGLIVLGVSLFSGYVIIAVLPILLGVRGITDVRRQNKRGLGLAITGLVAGILSGIIYLLTFIH